MCKVTDGVYNLAPWEVNPEENGIGSESGQERRGKTRRKGEENMKLKRKV
jgi:hypothetical protein